MTDTLLPPPIELLDLITAYQRSRALFSLVELGVPSLLDAEPLRLSALAEKLAMHPIALDRLLNAGVALGLLERGEGLYRNGPLARDFLVRGKPTWLGEQILLHARTTYPLWTSLTERLREWSRGATDHHDPVEEDQGSEALSAQHNLARMVGHCLARDFDFGQFRSLLDLGGGTGSMALAACAVHKELKATVFDLPEVVEVAKRFITAESLDARVSVAAGNFKRDAMPEGFDVVLLANLLSVSSEDTNRALLRRIYDALPEGGAVVLCGWILNDGRTSPTIPVLFCLQDISWQAPDVERSASTYIGWLEDEGFAEVEHHALTPPTSFIVGRKRTPAPRSARIARDSTVDLGEVA